MTIENVDQFAYYTNISAEFQNTYKEVIVNRVQQGTVAYRGFDENFSNAVELHLNDKSTGTLRELASIWLSGAEPYLPHSNDDPAYDAIRNGKFIECKPVTNGNPADGHGNINDHSFNRHNKFIQDELILQQSQFFGGMCAWIVEFPYEAVKETMEEQLMNASGRVRGSFVFRDWFQDAQVVYYNRGLIEDNRYNISGGKFNNPKTPWLFHWLMDNTS